MVIKDELIASHFYQYLMILQTIRYQYLMPLHKVPVPYHRIITYHKVPVPYDKVPVPYDKVPVPYQVELPRYCPAFSTS